MVVEGSLPNPEEVEEILDKPGTVVAVAAAVPAAADIQAAMQREGLLCIPLGVHHRKYHSWFDFERMDSAGSADFADWQRFSTRTGRN